jgi:chromosome segregation ATPase
VNTYLESLDTEHTDVDKLQNAVDSFECTAEKLDEKITTLEKEKEGLEKAVEEEKKALTGPKDDEKLKLKASIGVFASCEGKVELILIYGM